MEILHEASNLRIAADADVLVSAWTDAPRPGQLPLIADLTEGRLRERERGLFSVNVVLSRSPNFSAQVREEATAPTRRKLTKLGVTHIIMFSAFKGVAVRGFIGTMLLLARSTVETRVYGNFAEALPFMCTALGASSEQAWTQARLLATLTEAMEGLAREPGGA